MISSTRRVRATVAVAPVLDSAASLWSTNARIVAACASIPWRAASPASAARPSAASRASVMVSAAVDSCVAALLLTPSTRARWAASFWAAPPTTSSASRPRATSAEICESSAPARSCAMNPAVSSASDISTVWAWARGRSVSNALMSLRAVFAASRSVSASWAAPPMSSFSFSAKACNRAVASSPTIANVSIWFTTLARSASKRRVTLTKTASNRACSARKLLDTFASFAASLRLNRTAMR